MAKTEYRVTGMTCGHCEKAVREEVGAVDGVQHVDVSAAHGTLVVTSDQSIDEAAVFAAVEEAGYQAVHV